MFSSLQSYLGTVFKARVLFSVSEKLFPWAMVVACAGLLIGSVWGLVFAPSDYQQGEMVRVMYIHVPASWLALGIYTIAAVFSGIGLITRLPLCFLVSKALAPVGAGFTIISLITGSIWGKPTWGAWWVWDARLTSMLVLLFLYVGYLNLAHKVYNERNLSAASILLVIGWINIPIIKWSVDWWYTLHQPASLMRFGKPAIHSSMLWPLLIMAIGSAAYALALGCLNLKALIAERRREKDCLS